VKRAALTVALLAGACGATPTPTRDELAEALAGVRTLAPTDLSHIACGGSTGDRTGFPCRWREREGGRWRDWQGRLAPTDSGWRIVEAPTRRP
jgi:hypothetical protein